jgi:hypothetical protein
MSRVRPHRMLAVVARWSVGVALVTWRYLWETTPLHRVETQGDEADYPPPLPHDSVDERVLLVPDGYGRLFHRVFRVRIAAADLDATEVIHRVVRDLKSFVPTEVVDVHTGEVGAHGLEVGDDLLIEMPGPWNGPVKVVYRDASVLRLATLRGHLEVGQVQFHARPEGQLLTFEIELWARTVDRLVHLLYARLGLAKEVQLNMWVRFCLAVVRASGGRLVDGVHIVTRWVEPTQDTAVHETSAASVGRQRPGERIGVRLATLAVSRLARPGPRRFVGGPPRSRRAGP